MSEHFHQGSIEYFLSAHPIALCMSLLISNLYIQKQKVHRKRVRWWIERFTQQQENPYTDRRTLTSNKRIYHHTTHKPGHWSVVKNEAAIKVINLSFATDVRTCSCSSKTVLKTKHGTEHLTKGEKNINTCENSHQFNSKSFGKHTNYSLLNNSALALEDNRSIALFRRNGAHSFHLSRCTTKNVIIFTCLFPCECIVPSMVEMCEFNGTGLRSFEPIECILHSLLIVHLLAIDGTMAQWTKLWGCIAK